MKRKKGRLAIITRGPAIRSQTFVRRHIEFLNDGNTVVVFNRKRASRNLGKPSLYYPRASVEEYFRSFTNWSPYSGRKRRIETFFQERGVSHVLMEFGYVATDLGPQITQMGRKVFCMFRGNDASSRLRDATYRRLLRQVFPKLDGIIAVSSHLLDNLEQYGFKHEHAIVVPSGVDSQLFTPGKCEKGLCVSVGRLVAKKSPEVLIRAFARYCEEHDLRLEFIGSGDLQPMAERLVDELGIADRVAFRGHLSHNETRERLRKAMLYLQHFTTPPNGDSEGMPNVIQEAMACGLPIVTTRHAGIPDHITDGVNGVLAKPDDVEDFSNALERLLVSGELRQRLGENARAYAENESTTACRIKKSNASWDWMSLNDKF